MGTPSSSTRPSVDYSVSTDLSPISGYSTESSKPKQNRVALREYYNLQVTAPKPDDPSQISDINSEVGLIHNHTSLEASELDKENFDSDAFVRRVLKHQNLMELLTTYSNLLGEIRALDAEKKALVYDNYSKLIKATETIGKMRECVEAKAPVAGKLDLIMEGIYTKAEGLKNTQKKNSINATEKNQAERESKMVRAKFIARIVLEAPEKVRNLLSEGKQNEAREVWQNVRSLLQRWKEKGVGGLDVIECIEDGDAALKGEPPSDKSWVYIKSKKIELQH